MEAAASGIKSLILSIFYLEHHDNFYLRTIHINSSYAVEMFYKRQLLQPRCDKNYMD